MILPKLTNRQLEILLLLYKYRFLNTNQIQKLLKHKNPKRTQQWLKDLIEKEYIIARKSNKNKFMDNITPSVYSLSKLSRKRLLNHEKCERAVLNRIYREKNVLQSFVDHSMLITDIYLNIYSKLKVGEQLRFFTHSNLYGFDYFPDPLPDAYIAIKTEKTTKRYFLLILKDNAPLYQIEKFINQYVEYVDYNDWNKYTKDPLPSFLIICKNNFIKEKINILIKDQITDGKFYLATKPAITSSGFNDVWEKVEIE